MRCTCMLSNLTSLYILNTFFLKPQLWRSCSIFIFCLCESKWNVDMILFCDLYNNNKKETLICSPFPFSQKMWNGISIMKALSLYLQNNLKTTLDVILHTLAHDSVKCTLQTRKQNISHQQDTELEACQQRI